jgi:hypothetical protein
VEASLGKKLVRPHLKLSYYGTGLRVYVGPAVQEALDKRVCSQSQPLAQVVECLPSKCEGLSLNPITTNKQTNKHRFNSGYLGNRIVELKIERVVGSTEVMLSFQLSGLRIQTF